MGQQAPPTSELAGKLATTNAAQAAGVNVRALNEQGLSVYGWLNDPKAAKALTAALPRGMDAARFARIVQTEVRKNPALLNSEPQSFILAVLTAAQLGLEPGPLGHCYLTGPFNVKRGDQYVPETLLIIGYKGLKELAYRAGTVDLIDAVPVHQGEPFKVVRGSDQRLEHEELPEFAEAPVVAYYAIAFPKQGGRPVFEVMWPKDIEAIRKRSKAGDSGPWKTDFEAMALKTVTRRLLNRGKVRLTPEVQEAIQEDEARELGFDKPELMAPPDASAQPNGEAKEPPADAGGEPGQAQGEAIANAEERRATETATEQAQAETPKAPEPQGDPNDPGRAFRPQPKKEGK